MDRETNQETPSLLSNHSNNNREEDYSSPRKPPATVGGGGGGGGNSDRLKRDEWSEGAVSSLLEAYEAKWILRNRAKLKGQDWEDVAKHVSSRASSTKSPKTQTQCKNKIESMKKRYRSESATADASSWPLYSRLDLLLRGNAPAPALPPPPPPPPPPSATNSSSPHIILLEPPAATSQQPLVVHQLVAPLTALPPPPPPPPHGNIAQNSRGSNGLDRVAKEDGVGSKLSDQECDKNTIETDSSTPAIYSSDKEKLKSRNLKIRTEKKKQRRESCAVAESIRWLAEVVLRSEQARMETMKDLERMRAETEAKRGEMDLKRTEIIANTQLEIAKLFAGIAKGVDSSLRIGRS